MKQVLKILLSIFLFSYTSFAIHAKIHNPCCNKPCLGPCDGYPFLLPRSQGQNAVRNLMGWQQFLYRPNIESTNGAFAITMEYNKSMRAERIAEFYFGNQLANHNTIVIQGSGVQTRHPKAWVADYFGLPKDFRSEVHFNPTIDNFMVDIHLYIGLDDWFKGGYFRVHSPLTHTRWKFHMTECVRNFGTNPISFEPGYMGPNFVTRDTLPYSFSQVMFGQATRSNLAAIEPITFGDMKTPMCYGKFPICPLTKTMLADIHMALGWNHVKNCYHIGGCINMVFPTGTRPNACHLFEPIIGNGKHFELGFGLTGSWIFWQSDIHENRYLGLWAEATFNHLFKACQKRSFDFFCKPNSRYMLLEEFGKSDGKLKGNSTTAKYQYKSNLIPAINLTSLTVKSSITLQTDMVFKFGYVRDNWGIDVGYNFWARTSECFSCISCIAKDKYALKGDAWLYGEVLVPNGEESQTFGPFALSNSNSNAKINCVGTLDNPIPGFYEIEETSYELRQIGNPDNPLNISLPPVFIKQENINTCKSPSAITHKIFLHINYAWHDRCDERWVPFLGFGGSLELDHTGGVECCACNITCDNTCDNNCNNNFNNNCKCKKRAGVSQWGAWIKGGLSFD